MDVQKAFTGLANAVSRTAGKPATFVICCATIVAWGVSGPVFGFSDTWQLVINTGTTIITFLMVFLIQNTQNRDNAAIHAKLDELVRNMRGAKNTLVGIEKLTDQELDAILAREERDATPERRRTAAAARETLAKQRKSHQAKRAPAKRSRSSQSAS